MIEIINGIKQLGFGDFLAYTIFIWLIYSIIDGPVCKYFESILGIKHEIHWYDILLLITWIVIYIYGLIIYGKVGQ